MSHDAARGPHAAVSIECQVTGTAIVQRTSSGPMWARTDPAIHIAAEVLESSGGFVAERYTVAEWCPFARAYHGYLRSGTVQP